jgi:hypothetical protein
MNGNASFHNYGCVPLAHDYVRGLQTARFTGAYNHGYIRSTTVGVATKLPARQLKNGDIISGMVK